MDGKGTGKIGSERSRLGGTGMGRRGADQSELGRNCMGRADGRTGASRAGTGRDGLHRPIPVAPGRQAWARLATRLALALALTPAPVTAQDSALQPYVVEGIEIPAPLTDQPGNAGRGMALVRDTRNVTCLICHHLPIAGEPDMGRIGPDLAGVGSRMTPGALRLRLVNPKRINPDTIMPAYYRVEGLIDVQAPYVGRPIYTAQQIEDVVAYLSQLKEAAP